MLSVNDAYKLLINAQRELSTNIISQIDELLEKASEAYYNTDKLIMTDEEFDQIVYIYKSKGGIIKVGAKPTAGKGVVGVKHRFRELVGTLDKTNYVFEAHVTDATKKSVEKWLMTNANILFKQGVRKISLAISFKFDGNSISAEYVDGRNINSLTRGQDGQGMDLTHVFKDHTIPSHENVGIKYEVIISWENYKKLMEDLSVSYANPRSLVSGKLGDDNAYDYYKYMTLVPLWVKSEEREMTRMEELEFIEENFGEDNDLFLDMRVYEDLDISKASIKVFLTELYQMYTKYAKERDQLPFMIDGLVIEIMDTESRKVLGYVNDEPNWATALKFPYMEKKTKVTGFDYTLGDSGIITSRVWFEPVEFNGTKHEKQSLQNFKRYEELALGIGSDILVQYRNDTLTYVVPLDTENNRSIQPHPYTSECPVCGGEVGITETRTFAFCNNPVCEGKAVGRIQNYLIKMDIKGFKESTLGKIHEAGYLNSIIDLYNLDFDKVSAIEGLGEITAMSLIGAMQSKVPYDYEILGALGIPSFSTSKAKELCAVFTINDLMDMSAVEVTSSIISVEGFSDKTAKYILNGINENWELLQFLLGREHMIYKEYADKLNTGEKYKIVFTDFRDEALQYYVEMLGHKVTSSVSGKTNILVCPNVNGSTVKLAKAKDFQAKGTGIQIMTVEEFKEFVGYDK